MIFSEHIEQLYGVLLAVTIVIYFISKQPLLHNYLSGPSPLPVLEIEVNEKKEVVSFRMNMIKIYKISMMAATICAIMLVDFP